jgi:hypothetical protein
VHTPLCEQMSMIPEAKKKPSKQASRYGDVAQLPPVTAPSDIQLSQLQPGQKQELTIKLVQGTQLFGDIKREIAKLELSKKQAVNAKNILLVDEITGLTDQLIKLQKKLQSRITSLKKQLKVVPPDLGIWLDRIQTDCTQYLAQVKKAKKWLYRGTSGTNAFVAKSWLTREPKDSNKEAQVLFDQMLAQLGFVALRGNSIFTTSDFWHTKEFGDKTYVIFPVDNASNYTYTNQGDIVLDNVADVGFDTVVSDNLKKELLPYLNKIESQYGNKVPNSLRDLIYNTEAKWSTWGHVQSVLEKFIKTTKKSHDIPEKFLDADISKLLTPQSFVKKWEPKQTDLVQGIKKEREVYVSGVYYALEAETYGDFIAGKFGVSVESEQFPRRWD